MAEATRILVVDDSSFNREFLESMLQDDGVIISQACDGEEALDMLRDTPIPYDIMLLDLVMPKLDGFGVLEAVAKEHLAQDMPIVMISAEDTADFMSRAFDLGACDYIPRPFDANVVKRRVRNTLDLFRKQRTIAAQLRDANMRYMDTVKRMQSDMILYVHMNLDNDTYSESSQMHPYLEGLDPNGGIDELMARLFSFIPNDAQRNKAVEISHRASIIRSWEAGQDTIALEHDFTTLDGRNLKLVTSIGIVRNPVDGALEAILYSLDMSRAYVKRRIEELLYEDVYDKIMLVDVAGKYITTYDATTPDSVPSQYHYDHDSYYAAVSGAAETLILEQDRAFLLESAKIDNVCEALQEEPTYSFVVRTSLGDGCKIRYTFRYLDDSRDTLLIYTEDCTKSSETDALTGGLNRNGFESATAARLSIKDAVNDELAILFIDLRGFRTVNDLFGRETGDAILREYAASLTHSAIEPLATGRTDGDQFLCLVKSSMLDESSLRSALNFTAQIAAGKNVELHARCGIYPIKSTEFPVSSMCDAAQAALDAIDNEFAKPYAVFDASVHKSYLDREYLLSHIDSALDNGEFKPYYQPIVDAKTHQIASAEALVRWISPELGMVSPARFIPELERSGRISLVDLSIARSVQELLETRHAQGKRIVPVSTNLSRMDFYDEPMMQALLADTASATIPASYLRKELTESSYVAFTEVQRQVLAKLIEQGMPLLLDDFGTGASSFSAVCDIDFSIIKIDKSFIDGIGKSEKGDTLLYSIVRMAHSLGLKTVAEGVQDAAQAEFLTACECDYIQGYYFSRPLPADEFERLLDMDSVDWSAL